MAATDSLGVDSYGKNGVVGRAIRHSASCDNQKRFLIISKKKTTPPGRPRIGGFWDGFAPRIFTFAV